MNGASNDCYWETDEDFFRHYGPHFIAKWDLINISEEFLPDNSWHDLITMVELGCVRAGGFYSLHNFDPERGLAYLHWVAALIRANVESDPSKVLRRWFLTFAARVSLFVNIERQFRDEGGVVRLGSRLVVSLPILSDYFVQEYFFGGYLLARKLNDEHCLNISRNRIHLDVRRMMKRDLLPCENESHRPQKTINLIAAIKTIGANECITEVK